MVNIILDFQQSFLLRLGANLYYGLKFHKLVLRMICFSVVTNYSLYYYCSSFVSWKILLTKEAKRIKMYSNYCETCNRKNKINNLLIIFVLYLNKGPLLSTIDNCDSTIIAMNLENLFVPKVS